MPVTSCSHEIADELDQLGELIRIALRHLANDGREVLAGAPQPHVAPRYVLPHEMGDGIEMEDALKGFQHVLRRLDHMAFCFGVLGQPERKLRREQSGRTEGRHWATSPGSPVPRGVDAPVSRCRVTGRQ